MADLKRRIIAVFSAQNKAKGVMAGFSRDMNAVGRTMRRMAVGALAVAGVGGMGYMIKQTMTSIDQIAKMSDELQISTEALTSLEHAAKISGTSIESLHKGIGIFVRRMGEAKFGVGEGVRGLKMLNLTAEEMISMGTEKAFMTIAERISQAGTAAEQAGIAYNFFGRQGTQLLNMFQQGTAGIEAMREEAEKLGLTFSRFDAAQVEAANDALTRARAVLTGLFRQATIELAPYIETLADKFVGLATSGEGLGANVVNVFEQMSLAAIRFGGMLQGSSAKFKAFQAGALEGFAGIIELSAKLEKYSPMGGAGKLARRIAGAEDPLDIAARYRSRAAELMEAAGREAAGTYGQENAVKRFYEGLRTEAAGQREAIEERARQRAAAGVGVEPLDEDIMQEHYDKLNAMGGTYQEMQERMARQRIETEIALVTQQMEAETAAREKAAERRKRIAEDIALSMAGSWSSAIDQMMFEGKKFWDAMTDMARSLVREIAKIIIYKQFAEPMAYAIMGQPVPSAQHGGDVLKTGLAVIHRGETYSGVGKGGGGPASFDFHIHNEGQEKLEISRVESYIVSDQRIVDVFVQRSQTDAKLRRSIVQAR